MKAEITSKKDTTGFGTYLKRPSSGVQSNKLNREQDANYRGEKIGQIQTRLK